MLNRWEFANAEINEKGRGLDDRIRGDLIWFSALKMPDTILCLAPKKIFSVYSTHKSASGTCPARDDNNQNERFSCIRRSKFEIDLNRFLQLV